MMAVFSGFIVPDDPIIKSVGFAFAFGIMVDAFLVRMTLIPALMTVWAPAPGGCPRGSTGRCPTSISKARPSSAHRRPLPPRAAGQPLSQS